MRRFVSFLAVAAMSIAAFGVEVPSATAVYTSGLDLSFGSSAGWRPIVRGPGSLSPTDGADVAVGVSGRIVTMQQVQVSVGGTLHKRTELTAYLEDGQVDVGFGINGAADMHPYPPGRPAGFEVMGQPGPMAVLPDGSIVICGKLRNDGVTITNSTVLLKILPNGLRDPNVGGGFGTSLNGGGCRAMAVAPDGSVYISFDAYVAQFRTAVFLAKLTPTLQLDTAFGNQGYIQTAEQDWHFHGMGVQPDGKLVVLFSESSQIAGESGFSHLERYLPNGTLDQPFTWPLARHTRHLGIAADGRIITFEMKGLWTDWVSCTARYWTSDGGPDTSRQPVAVPGYGCTPTVSSTGAIYALGTNGMTRVTPEGRVDPNFGATEFGGPKFITGNGFSVSSFAVDSLDRLMVTTQKSGVDGNLYRMLSGGPVTYDFDIESLLGSHEWQERVADPVDTATGNFYLSNLDVDEVGLATSVVRAYNGLSIVSSALGERWSFGVGPRLESKGNRIDVVEPDGTRFRFFSTGGGGFVRADGFKGSLLLDPAAPATPPGSLVPMMQLVHDGGLVEKFDFQGRLTSQTSWDGQSATLTYGVDGRLEGVANSVGSSLVFGYNTEGRLKSIVSASGNTAAYSYNAEGLLSQATDEHGGVTRYKYTAEGWLKSITDPTGVVTIVNTYDSRGRVWTQTASGGGVTTYGYDTSTRITTVHDSVTNTTLAYSHDLEGKVLSISDPFGKAVQRTYDAANNLTDGTARDGGVSQGTYDTAGNPRTVTEAGVGTTTYEYDDLNRVEWIQDPSGQTTTYGYEGAERLPSTVTDGLGAVTSYDIVDGLVMSVTDPDGVITTNSYNSRRLLKSTTNAAGNVTSYEYDGKGRIKKVTTPSGQITTTTYNDQGFVGSVTAADGGVTSYTYDASGRVLTTTDPTNAVTVNTYAAATGLLATMTAPNGGVTTYEYDANGQLRSVQEPGAAKRTIGYGALGRVSSITNEIANLTALDYDVDGRPATITAPDSGKVATEYNAAGQVTKKVDEEGRVTATNYDDRGRVESILAPGNRMTIYAYDAVGRVKTVTGPLGNLTNYEYTPAGRLKSIIDPTGLKTVYVYDTSGRLRKETAPGVRETRYTYTPDSLVESVTSPEGLVTLYVYDPAGRVKTVTDPAGVVTTRTWTKRGELESEQVGAQGKVGFVYDPVGTLKSVTDALGRATQFTYDQRGNLRLRTNALGKVDEWTWNDADQLLTTKDPLGRTSAYSYDSNGRVQTVTDPMNRKVTNSYFKDGRIKQVAWLNGTTSNYGYTPAGDLNTMNDGTGDWKYTYDESGRVTSEKSPTGRTIRWSYDAAGRRTRLVYPDGSSVNFGYDAVTGDLKTITPGETTADTFTQTVTTADTAKWTVTPTSGGTATITSNAMVAGWTNTAGSSVVLASKAAATADHEVSLTYRFPQTATNTATLSVALKVSATSQVRVQIAPGATTGTLQQITAASPNPVSLGTFPVPGGTGTTGLRVRLTGTTLKARAWNTTAAEPATWTTAAAVSGVTTAGTDQIIVARSAGTGTVIIDDWRQTDPTVAPTPLVTYTYNKDGQVTNEALIGGSRGYGYDKGRLATFNETLPGLTRSTALGYDTTGRIQSDTTGGVTSTYGYDPASQLISVTPTADTASSWTFDELGRRKTETVGATTTRYVYDDASQLCWSATGTVPASPTCAAPTATATKYSYDASGKRTKETVTATDTLTYGYDKAGRLVSLARLSGGTTTNQTRSYSPDNRMIATKTGTVTRAFDWDPTVGASAPLLTIGTPGAAARNLIDGPAGWVAARTGPASAAIGQDVFGSALNTTTITDLARGTSYNPWGNPVGGTVSLNPTLGYRGELTIDTLTHLRARDYHPGTGQFTSRDPLPGVTGGPSVANPYHYVDNTPLMAVDPTGMFAIGDDNFGVGMMPTPTSAWQRWAGPAAGFLATTGCFMFAASLTPATVGASMALAGACTALGGMVQRSTTSFANGGNTTNALTSAFDPKSVLIDFTIGAATDGLFQGLNAGATKLNNARTTRNLSPNATNTVNLASPSRTSHILDGEVRPNGTYGGGHRPGTGYPNKSEFPAGWSDDKIMHEISDVATDPKIPWRPGDRAGDVWANGTRDGVDIEVLIRNGEIWTGYPTNTPRNPR